MMQARPEVDKSDVQRRVGNNNERNLGRGPNSPQELVRRLAANSPSNCLGPDSRGSSNSNSHPHAYSPFQFSAKGHECESYLAHMFSLMMSPPSHKLHPAGCLIVKVNFLRFDESMVNNDSVENGSCGRKRLYMGARISRSP